jgi:methionine-rich copper-binding protein CopC
MLEHAVPAVGAAVRAAPLEIRLEFSEGVEPALSRITLADASGRAVPLGAVTNPKGDREILAASVSAPLAAGVYHVTWRVVSVDSHVTQGDFNFTIAP